MDGLIKPALLKDVPTIKGAFKIAPDLGITRIEYDGWVFTYNKVKREWKRERRIGLDTAASR